MKKNITGMLLLICIILVTGCSNQFANSNYDNKEKIISETNSFNVNGVDQKISDNRFVCDAKFEGMDVIWSYEAKEDNAIIGVSSMSVRAGKAKLVLILPNGTVETLIEKSSESDDNNSRMRTISLPKGNNRIKLVTSKGTDVKFDITMPVGEFHELGL